MKPRRIRERIEWVGAIDWNRRLFDSLIPLPDGTSYNAYLVRGSEKTVLFDSVDTAMEGVLMDQLDGISEIHYVVSHHTEQDHSGAIPAVLNKYPAAQVLCSTKAKDMLVEHLHISPDRIRTVADGESISIGDKTLNFIYTPWVHWPETMSTYIPEDRILFSCDFFGSHVATTELYAGEDPYVREAAKRYFAEIMMPFRKVIQTNIKKIQELKVDLIAPSHGPVYDKPGFILDAYLDWVSEHVANHVVIPYISMHGSTEMMVNRLVGSLAERGVRVHKFDLSATDLGKLAISLVDAATIVLATPTVLAGPHPAVSSAAHLVNALRPKLKYAAVIGSYGWATKVVEQMTAMIPSLKVELLGSVTCKGRPRAATFAELDALADVIKERHVATSRITPVV